MRIFVNWTTLARRESSRLRRFCSRSVLATGLIGALGVSLLAAAPALAETDTCGYGSSGGNVLTCVHMNYGDGSQVAASARVETSTRTLDACLTQNGTTLGCTGFKSVSPGHVITYAPAIDLKPATYCAITYRRNSDGSSTEIGDECAYGN